MRSVAPCGASQGRYCPSWQKDERNPDAFLPDCTSTDIWILPSLTLEAANVPPDPRPHLGLQLAVQISWMQGAQHGATASLNNELLSVSSWKQCENNWTDGDAFHSIRLFAPLINELQAYFQRLCRWVVESGPVYPGFREGPASRFLTNHDKA